METTPREQVSAEFQWPKIGGASEPPRALSQTDGDPDQPLETRESAEAQGYAAGMERAQTEISAQCRAAQAHLEELAKRVEAQTRAHESRLAADALVAAKIMFRAVFRCELATNPQVLQTLKEQLHASLPDREERAQIVLSARDFECVLATASEQASPVNEMFEISEQLPPGVVRIQADDYTADLDITENLSSLLLEVVEAADDLAAEAELDHAGGSAIDPSSTERQEFE
ncbi:MAG: FliH/SctL family protein [Pseudomonadota bacterium]